MTLAWGAQRGAACCMHETRELAFTYNRGVMEGLGCVAVHQVRSRTSRRPVNCRPQLRFRTAIRHCSVVYCAIFPVGVGVITAPQSRPDVRLHAPEFVEVLDANSAIREDTWCQ
jgi:hypothetical protein